MKPKIAICAKSQRPLVDIWNMARNNGYVAVDWSIELNRLSLFKSERFDFQRLSGDRDNQEVRYHCPLDQFEIAHINPFIAKNSVKLIRKCIDAVKAFDAKYLTLHISGANKIEDLSWDAAVKNLTEAVSYGNEKGIIVCLENLKSGWTSDPVLFSKLVRLSGARVTFDMGHANSSVYASSGEASCIDFLGTVSDLVVNAHIYEAEDPYHIAPEDLSVIEPVLKELLKTQCDWWVIELDDPDSVEKTRLLLEDFLSKN